MHTLIAHIAIKILQYLHTYTIHTINISTFYNKKNVFVANVVIIIIIMFLYKANLAILYI